MSFKRVQKPEMMLKADKCLRLETIPLFAQPQRKAGRRWK